MPLALARSRRRRFARSPRNWRGLRSHHEESRELQYRAQHAPRRRRSKRTLPSQGQPLNPAQRRMPRGRARVPRGTQSTRAASPLAVPSGRSRHGVALLVVGLCKRQSRWSSAACHRVVSRTGGGPLMSDEIPQGVCNAADGSPRPAHERRDVPTSGGYGCAAVTSTMRRAGRVVPWAQSRDRRLSTDDHGAQISRDRGRVRGLGSARSPRIGKLRDVWHLRASWPDD
jgi:hypothetical protein